MDGEVNVINTAINCIKNNKSFIIHGAAGSGKTETLKELLQSIYNQFPNKKIICITHTNVAVDEIRSRTKNQFEVFTIHNFLYNLISNYNKDIKDIILEIFRIPSLEEYALEKKVSEINHEIYKKIYEKYRKKHFKINNISISKVVGKRDFDKNPDEYIKKLNYDILKLNNEIKQIINKECDYRKIKYNQTKFDSFKNFSYGHDSLLKIFCLLVKKHPTIRRIINDKYNIILIDEFQDTNKDIISTIIEYIVNNKTLIGLFGDNMQAIYQDGVSNVTNYIDKGILKDIKKIDNYRCSDQVIKFLNTIRNDFFQEIALKKKETIADRQGKVSIYYHVDDNKPTSASTNEQLKSEYMLKLDEKIEYILDLRIKEGKNFKTLVLSNGAVAKKLHFDKIYTTFYKKYSMEVKDEIEKMCEKLGWFDIAELYINYINKKYNMVIMLLKKNKFYIRNVADKKKICEVFDTINLNMKIDEVIKKLIENNMYIESETRTDQINYIKKIIETNDKDSKFLEFSKSYNDFNTHKRMIDAGIDINEDQFDNFKSQMIDDCFYRELLSGDFQLSEIINYYNYVNEKSDYITMHKTKGSNIDNVLVILDEFFWFQIYNFGKIFNPDETIVFENTKKLFYVACSRAKFDLNVFRIIKKAEEENFKSYFENCKICEIIKID